MKHFAAAWKMGIFTWDTANVSTTLEMRSRRLMSPPAGLQRRRQRDSGWEGDQAAQDPPRGDCDPHEGAHVRREQSEGAPVDLQGALSDLTKSDPCSAHCPSHKATDGVNLRGLSRKHIFDSIKASLKRMDVRPIAPPACLCSDAANR